MELDKCGHIEEGRTVNMGSQLYRLIPAYFLPRSVAAFCVVRAEEIVFRFRFITPDTLGDRDLHPDTLREQFLELHQMADTQPLLDAAIEHPQLYVETFCYTLFWADYLYQARRDRALYLKLRPECQRRSLTLGAGIANQSLASLEDRVMERAPEYAVNPAQNSISLMQHVEAYAPGEPLTYATAAYAYVTMAFAECFDRLLVDIGGRTKAKFTCPSCGAALKIKRSHLLEDNSCSNCGDSVTFADSSG